MVKHNIYTLQKRIPLYYVYYSLYIAILITTYKLKIII